jgi:hypothetical protein
MLPIVLVALVVVAVLLLVLRRRLTAIHPETPMEPKPKPPKPRAAVLTEAVPAPATISGEVERPRIRRPVLAPPPVRDSSDALDTLDALLAELESTTVRIDGADALDESSVTELESLAARLEAAAESLAPR